MARAESLEHTLRDGRVVELREARIEDADALLEFIDIVAGETDNLSFGPGEFGVTVGQERIFIDRAERSPVQVFFVAVVDGSIVASLNFHGRDRSRTRHSGEIGMSVVRSHWGLGVGGLLLTAVIDWAKQTGIVTRIMLRVRTDNVRAIALYSRFGFVHEGTARGDFVVDGVTYDHHVMALVFRAGGG